ncbi:MAG: TAT-variant-translocated molybdopterin oxidoreductase [Opitutales bacterium]
MTLNPDSSSSHMNGQRYWKSLDDLAETPAFNEWVEREFPQGASELDGVNRRHFLKIMAASFGMAGLGLSGCRQPKELVLAYARQPENTIPGVPNFYCSAYPGQGEHLPLIVETHQNRPTKIEGNPSFANYGGTTDSFAQASVLDLYDPDRATTSKRNGSPLKLKDTLDALSAIQEELAASRGAGFVFVAEPSASPSRQRLVKLLKQQYPEALWTEHAAFAFDGAERAASKFFGLHVRPYYLLDKADRVLSVDHDFLQNEPGSLGYARGFGRKRKVDSAKDARAMNRLYAVESDFTLTGAMADHRLRLDAGRMTAFLAALAVAVFEQRGVQSPIITKMRDRASGLDVDPAWINACADDLIAHEGKAVVMVGNHLPEEAHVIGLAINDVLRSRIGPQQFRVLDPNGYTPTPGLDAAVDALNAGSVQQLVILGGNPAFDAPADLKFGAAAARADSVTYFGYSANETSDLADLHVAASHYLESWSDGRAFDGTYLPVQPMIEPLFDTIGELEFLARIVGKLPAADGHSLVRETFAGLAEPADLDAAFHTFLAEGLLENSDYLVYTGRLRPRDAAERLPGTAPVAPAGREHLDVRFVPSRHVWDGRFANNGWMLEVPEPMTKLTWDNAILISPRLAAELQEASGVRILPDTSFMAEQGQLVTQTARFKRGKEMAPLARLTVNGATVEAPLHVVPGLSNYTVVLPVGFGRKVVGRVGQGTGFNFYPLRSSVGEAFASGATIEVTEATYKLANTQEHWSMEGRAILREATNEDYAKHPDFAEKMGMEAHSPPVYGKYKNAPPEILNTKIPRGGSAYKTPSFDAPQQWGMSIDLNTCIGCNACVVACQSENNIPIVGKDQVLRGREMHWIRLDRYYSAAEGDDQSDAAGHASHSAAPANPALSVPEDVQVSFMGVACMHCELAPCETVCPVNATVHDSQGLNVMAYNRCVGTRYCANNCPYKVRRFNFFDWNKRQIGEFYKGPLGKKNADVPNGEIIAMGRNPDVTVRMRGVMEKCTYCVQRIEAAKIRQKSIARDSSDIKVPDGTIKTACQQVCPTESIQFGDTIDPESAVYRAKQSDRNYAVLGYLNTRPRTTFLAKLRNPNPSMPKGATYSQPFSRQEYEARYGHGSGHHDEAETAAAPSH